MYLFIICIYCIFYVGILLINLQFYTIPYLILIPFNLSLLRIIKEGIYILCYNLNNWYYEIYMHMVFYSKLIFFINIKYLSLNYHCFDQLIRYFLLFFTRKKVPFKNIKTFTLFVICPITLFIVWFSLYLF